MNGSHESSLIRKNGKLYLHHASQIKMKVVGVNFVRYLFHYQDSKTLKGFNLIAVYFFKLHYRGWCRCLRFLIDIGKLR